MAHRILLLFFLSACLMAAPCAAQLSFTGPNTNLITGFNTTGGIIPDAAGLPNFVGMNTNQVSNTVTIVDSRIIDNVRFQIEDLTHTWVGDLVASVSHTGVNQFGVTDTVTATLFERTGREFDSNGNLSIPTTQGDSTDVDGDYFFRDDAVLANSPASADFSLVSDNLNIGAIPSGSYFATDAADNVVNLDAIFAGRQAGGEWVLNLRDDGPRIRGEFGGFGVDILTQAPAVPEPASGIVLFTTTAVLFSLRRRRV